MVGDNLSWFREAIGIQDISEENVKALFRGAKNSFQSMVRHSGYVRARLDRIVNAVANGEYDQALYLWRLFAIHEPAWRMNIDFYFKARNAERIRQVFDLPNDWLELAAYLDDLKWMLANLTRRTLEIESGLLNRWERIVAEPVNALDPEYGIPRLRVRVTTNRGIEWEFVEDVDDLIENIAILLEFVRQVWLSWNASEDDEYVQFSLRKLDQISECVQEMRGKFLKKAGPD